MHWINTDRSEKEIIKAWSAEQNTKNLTETYLAQPDEKMESYWTSYNNDKNIIEYDFSSLPELSNLLKTELKEQYFEELVLPITVAAFKERARILDDSNEDLNAKKKMDGFSLPEFVYVF